MSKGTLKHKLIPCKVDGRMPKISDIGGRVIIECTSCEEHTNVTTMPKAVREWNQMNRKF